jgi:hypothetical protein
MCIKTIKSVLHNTKNRLEYTKHIVYMYIYIYSVKTHNQIRATTCFGPADGPSSGCSGPKRVVALI